MSMNSFHARTTRPKAKPAPKPVVHLGIRADALLVKQGLAASRTLAQRLIEAGRVHQKVGAGETAPILKPAQLLPADAALLLVPDDSR
ncbi:MAG: S4 domain-containing protein [Pseudomonadota bacterium]